MTEGLDTGTPMGEAVLTILGALAKLERDAIVERVKMGQARERGKLIGRRPNPMDLDKVMALRRAGRSWRSIARALKVRFNTVRRQVLAACGADPAPAPEVGRDRVPKPPPRLGEAGIRPDTPLGRG